MLVVALCLVQYVCEEVVVHCSVVDDAKCIVVTRVCVSVRLSAVACLHYCTDPDVTWGGW